MSDIVKGKSFSDGDVVHGSDLNTLVDSAVIQPAFISAKSPLTPVEPTEDYLVILEGDSSTLKKVLVSNVPGVASVAVVSHIPNTNVTPSGAQIGPVVALDINQTAVPGNSVLAGPPGGASGVPFYRHLVSHDSAFPVQVIAALDINWSLGNIFFKNIAASGTFTFNADGPGLAVDGQTIVVELFQGGSGNNIVHWPSSIWWEGGLEPVLTTGAGRIDLFQFWYILGGVIGKRIVTNAHP